MCVRVCVCVLCVGRLAVYENSKFSTSLSTLNIYLTVAILVGVKWSHCSFGLHCPNDIL